MLWVRIQPPWRRFLEVSLRLAFRMVQPVFRERSELAQWNPRARMIQVRCSGFQKVLWMRSLPHLARFERQFLML